MKYVSPYLENRTSHWTLSPWKRCTSFDLDWVALLVTKPSHASSIKLFATNHFALAWRNHETLKSFWIKDVLSKMWTNIKDSAYQLSNGGISKIVLGWPSYMYSVAVSIPESVTQQLVNRYNLSKMCRTQLLENFYIIRRWLIYMQTSAALICILRDFVKYN